MAGLPSAAGVYALLQAAALQNHHRHQHGGAGGPEGNITGRYRTLGDPRFTASRAFA